MLLEYPNSISSKEYCFKVNTDDYFDPEPISNHLKENGINYKKSKSYSKTKLIGHHIYKIKADKPIKSFEENIEFCENLFKNF